MANANLANSLPQSKSCSVATCDRPTIALGFCTKHYQRVKRYGTTDSRRHNATTHSTKTREYAAWQAAKNRCYLPSTRDFHRYGGRGIVVCDRWLHGEKGKHPFVCFLEDMGSRPSDSHSLDRIDGDGNYEAANCRWATPKEQGRNKCTNRLLTAEGVTLTVTEWAEVKGLGLPLIWARVHYGWCDECIVTIPKRGGTCAHRAAKRNGDNNAKS